MRRDPSQDPDNAGQRTGTSEAERQERITQLAYRRSKLSPDEAALLREVFPEILAAHHTQVWYGSKLGPLHFPAPPPLCVYKSGK